MKVFIHPEITYLPKEKLVIEITDKNSNPYRFNSRLNDNPKDNMLNIPLIKYREYDYNNDGLINEFVFHIAIPYKTENPENIRNIKILFFFDYNIDDYYVKNLMKDSLCEINLETPYGASYVKTVGNIELIQNDVFPCDEPENIISTEFDDIKKEYESRKIYTKYNYQKIVMPRRSEDFVVIDATIRVPLYQEVMIKTPPFSGLKFAWMKYFAILIPFVILTRIIFMVIIKANIVVSKKSNDLPRFKTK